MPKKMKASGVAKKVATEISAAAPAICASRRKNPRHAILFAVRQIEAEADEKQERAGDASGIPARTGLEHEVWRDHAEHAQIPAEMKRRHGDQRHAADQIDQRDAKALPLRLRVWPHGLGPKAASRASEKNWRRTRMTPISALAATNAAGPANQPM